jgi:hypothetical protein
MHDARICLFRMRTCPQYERRSHGCGCGFSNIDEVFLTSTGVAAWAVMLHLR